MQLLFGSFFIIISFFIFTQYVVQGDTLSSSSSTKFVRGTPAVSIPNKKENLASVIVGEPTVFELPFKSSALSSEDFYSSKDSKLLTPVEKCSLLLHIQDAQPNTKYEARVSFAGSPPAKYDLKIVNLVVAPTKDGDDENSSGVSKKQSRVLLDTERVQFTTNNNVVENDKTKKNTNNNHLLKNFQHAVSADKKSILLPIDDSASPSLSTNNLGLCVKILDSFGVPSQQFYDLTHDDDYKIKFVHKFHIQKN